MAVALFNDISALNASEVSSAESVGGLCTVKEVGTYGSRETFQDFHLHRVKLPVEMATKEVGIALSILESSIDLRRYPPPVSGASGHRIVHSLGSGVETPIVSTSEEVDLVLLRTPDQGSMDRGPLQAQLGEWCGA